MVAECQECKQAHLHESRWSSLGRRAARQMEGPRKADFPQFSLLLTQCGVFWALCTKIAAAGERRSSRRPWEPGTGLACALPHKPEGCRQESKGRVVRPFPSEFRKGR